MSQNAHALVNVATLNSEREADSRWFNLAVWVTSSRFFPPVKVTLLRSYHLWQLHKDLEMPAINTLEIKMVMGYGETKCVFLTCPQSHCLLQPFRIGRALCSICERISWETIMSSHWVSCFDLSWRISHHTLQPPAHDPLTLACLLCYKPTVLASWECLPS